MTDYSGFHAEDFALDTYFLQWIYSPDSSSNEFWYNWLAQHPDKQETIAQARHLVLMTTFKEEPISTETIEEMWAVIDQTTQAHETQVAASSIFVRWKTSFRIAAGILLLIVATSLVWLIKEAQPNSIVIATKTSQVRVVTLPDKSVVTLNANTSIRYQSSLATDSVREVWLDGEALFQVKKLTKATQFVVHTPVLNIKVLGTTFTVNTRRQKAKVVLNEGKVALQLHTPKNNLTIAMKPGELVEYTQGAANASKRLVAPQNYDAWTRNRLVFQETSLREIAELLHDTQGIDMKFEEADLGNLLFSGSVGTNQTDLLLRKLAKVFHLHITQQNNQVLVARSTPYLTIVS